MNDSNNKGIEPRDFISPQLIETGKFSSSYSKAFLETTCLPGGLLILCVEHLTRSACKQHNNNNNVDSRKGNSYIISNTHLNQICQGEKYPSPSFLLDRIRDELKIMGMQLKIREKNNHAAKMLIDWLGPVHWEAALEGYLSPRKSTGIGICPNKDCGMLIIKEGGCECMFCSCCHHDFLWPLAELDSNVVAEMCHAISRDGSRSTTNKETVFCRRILNLAEQAVRLAIQSSSKKRKGKRPLLKTDKYDVMESFQYQGPSCHFLGFEDDSNDDDLECCEHSFSVLPHEKISPEIHESSSVGCSHSRSKDISLREYVAIVSDGDESCSAACEGSDWEESSSFSIISGCETVHSLDDPYGTEEGTTAMLSYCNAMKLGISVAKKAKEQSIEEIASVNSSSTLTTSPLLPNGWSWVVVSNDNLSNKQLEKVSARLSPCQNVYRGQKNANEKKDDPNHCYDELDDVFWSIYDGAKSGHGGRSSSRFRGNRRTQQSGWGNQRRPNWSRKRRKEQKFNRLRK